MEVRLGNDYSHESNSRIRRQQQNLLYFASTDENTFSYLPKRSKSIGLSTPTMYRVSSKYLKSYKQFGLFLDGLDPVAYNPAIDPRPRCCFNCWSPDHRLCHCPEPLSEIFCCNCGRRYIKIDKCPRCARVFWDLDEAARQWLISYIPDEIQENLTDCSKRNWSKYKDDDSSSCKGNKSDRCRQSEGNHVREDWGNCESSSAIFSKALDRDESEDDDWWDCSTSNNDIVEEQLQTIVKKKKEEGEKDQTDPLADAKTRHTKESVQEVVEESDITGENQLNSLGKALVTMQIDEDHEDYDNIIVDEDQQMEESYDVGDIVRSFLSLLKAAKYLPLQKQHSIVLRFVSECRKKV